MTINELPAEGSSRDIHLPAPSGEAIFDGAVNLYAGVWLGKAAGGRYFDPGSAWNPRPIWHAGSWMVTGCLFVTFTVTSMLTLAATAASKESRPEMHFFHCPAERCIGCRALPRALTRRLLGRGRSRRLKRRISSFCADRECPWMRFLPLRPAVSSIFCQARGWWLSVGVLRNGVEACRHSLSLRY